MIEFSMNVVNEIIKNSINEIIAVYKTLINISGSLYVGRIISCGITIHDIDSASFIRILAAINESTGMIAINKHPIPRHNGWGSGIEGFTTLLEKIVCLGILIIHFRCFMNCSHDLIIPCTSAEIA